MSVSHTLVDVSMYVYNMLFFFFNDTATTEIYTLSLHDALPIWLRGVTVGRPTPAAIAPRDRALDPPPLSFAQERLWLLEQDRKSTRLNSSHANISYAVFCLKKKKTKYTIDLSSLFNIAPSIS